MVVGEEPFAPKKGKLNASKPASQRASQPAKAKGLPCIPLLFLGGVSFLVEWVAEPFAPKKGKQKASKPASQRASHAFFGWRFVPG